MTEHLKTVDRVVAILNHLAESQVECGITEISRQLGLSKATIYRILSSLERAQWVVQKPGTRGYTLGSKVLGLCVSMLSNFSLIRDCVPHLKQLRDATGETAILNIRDGLQRLVVEQVQGYHEVRYLAEPGNRLPLWSAAPSKVILAFMEENEIEAVIGELMRSEVKALASGPAVDVDSLREELADIRRKGFAFSVGERVKGAFGMAAPIFDRDRRVVGSVSVAGPLTRVSADTVAKYSPLVRQAAREISLRLGNPMVDATTDKT